MIAVWWLGSGPSKAPCKIVCHVCARVRVLNLRLRALKIFIMKPISITIVTEQSFVDSTSHTSFQI